MNPLPPCSQLPVHLRKAGIGILLAGQLLTTPSGAVDVDGDGIPSDWEAFRGTSDSDPSDALLDFDGDGLNNYLEYLTQGRPWGNYAMQRFPWALLPPGVPANGVTSAEILAANRAGEYLINCYDTAGGHTFLWTPQPGSPLAAEELTAIPVTLSQGVLLNDLGEILLQNPATSTGEIRSLRNWAAPAAELNWYPAYGESALALSNDDRALILSETSEWLTYPGGGTYSGILKSYVWRGGDGDSGAIGFGYDPYSSTLNLDVAADSSTGAYFLGSRQFSNSPLEPLGWTLPFSGVAFALPALPATRTGLTLSAVAAGKAAGTAWNDATSSTDSIYFDGIAWQTVAGGAAGDAPWLTGVSDNGFLLGWNTSQSPYTAFLWNGLAVEMTIARPETAGGIVPVGLTGTGAIYGLDYGDYTTSAEPVVFRPLPNTLGDGSAGEPEGQLADADGDGIPDSREAALATSAQNADTDGDGLYDFFEMLLGKNPAVPGNSAPVPGATGLQIHSPSPTFWPVSRETAGN